MRLGRRTFLSGGASALGASVAPRAFAQAVRVHHVREFGAKGDGVTNDTAALAAAARFIEQQGGGTLVFDRRTYLIGRQRFGVSRGWAYEPADVIAIRNCPGRITLTGNGAVLRSEPGLRFGAFDPATGRPSRRALPLYDTSYLASPFRAAILLESNRGDIDVSGFEIDGRIRDQIIGGKWGDSGWQVPHHGINLLDNRGPQRISSVYVHHLGGDGIIYLAVIKGERAARVPTQIIGCRSEYNGRQGLSIVGGWGITVSRSRFSYTGKNGVIDSNPHAGLDVEAEGGGLIRDVAFTDCEFVDNAGAGFVADSGNSSGITFRRCRFVGSSNYAIWPNKPGISFYDSVIVGAAVAFYSEREGGGPAPQFHHCRFTDDPALSPNHRVFGKQVDLGASTGVMFDDCDFEYRSMSLPATQRHTRFHNCRMSSLAPGKAQLNGIFTGVNVIRGGADLSESEFRGRIIHNGRVLSSGS